MRQLVFVLALLSAPCVWAAPYIAQLADANLVAESLSDSLPIAIAPFALSTDDFILDIENPEIKSLDVQLRLIPNSVQWSRVRDYFVVPRASMEISVPSSAQALVRTTATLAPLTRMENGRSSAVVLVSLLESSLSDLELEINTSGRILKSVVHVRPRPRAGNGVIALDVSCTRRPVEVLESKLQAGQWIYIACRPIETRSEKGRAQAQEFYILWSGKKSVLNVNDIPIESVNSEGLGLWEVMASPGQTLWTISHGSDQFQLRSFANPETHRGSFALAVGPYNTTFDGGGQTFSGIAALTSLYGSMALADSVRAIYFAEVAATPQLFSDYGFYFELETASAFDKRLSLNLLLGVHGAAFFASGGGSGSSLSYTGHIDGPQGFELVYSDPHLPLSTFSSGAFLAPANGVNTYSNVWFRWARPKFFVELNYLSWAHQIDQTIYHSSSTGVSVGIPVLRFF